VPAVAPTLAQKPKRCPPEQTLVVNQSGAMRSSSLLSPKAKALDANAKEKGNEKSRVVDQECVRSRSNALDASPTERDQNCCAFSLPIGGTP
jgi:hypothetical protein